MSQRLKLSAKNKSSLIWMALPVVLAVAGWFVYRCFGRSLIEAMYEGRSFSVLNNLIKYQYKKPVEYYLCLADIVFYKFWILAVIVIVLIIVFRRGFTSTCRKLDVGSEYSLHHLKIIFFISLFIRVFFLPWAFNLNLNGDEEYYWLIPQKLLSGDFAYTVYRPPLWGYLLFIPAAIMDHVFMARVFASLVGACVPVLIYFLATKVFDKRVGFIAALIYALYPEHVGFSHYLWAEGLFICVCLLSVYFLFLFDRDKQGYKYFFLSFFTAGIALLTRESGAILFAGLAVATFFLETKVKIKKLTVACLLFIAPAIAYSITASYINKRVVVLSDAPITNFRAAAGLYKDDYSFEAQADKTFELMDFIKERSVLKTVKMAKEQFYNLWTPNSFPILRLLDGHPPYRQWKTAASYASKWGYDDTKHWVCAYIVASSYILVILLGTFGLCLSNNSAFRVFSIVCVVCLSLTSFLAFSCSRFRLPFEFIFVIYSAYLLVNWKSLTSNLKNPKKMLPLLFLLILFSHIVYVKWPTFGIWG